MSGPRTFSFAQVLRFNYFTSVGSPQRRFFVMLSSMGYKKTIGDLTVAVSEPEGETSGLCVLLPGYLDTKDYAHLTLLAGLLSQKGLTAVSFDPSGTWESAGAGISAYTITNYLKNVGEVITHFLSLRHLSEIILIGHSLGGQVAILAGASNPKVSAVVAIMPPKANERKKEWGNEAYKISRRDLPYEREKNLKITVPRSFIEDAEQYDVMKVVGGLNKPLLLVAGESDNVFPPASVREIYDKAREPKSFVVIKGIGHDYRFSGEEIGRVNAEVLEFLTRSGMIRAIT